MGRVSDAAPDAPPDASDSGPDAAPDATRDLPAPSDSGDTSRPPPDVVATECTPREIGCTPDNGSIRTCSDQGRWMVTSMCPAQTACSAGVCLCPAACAGAPIAEAQTPGVVDDLAGGGRFLYLADKGPRASIRRFDLSNGMETVVKSGGPDFSAFALDSDVLGNLLWCSDVRGAVTTGELVYGTQQLDTGACTHVRRHNNFVYFKSDVLYRKTLDPSSTRETVTREPMATFEIAGDSLFFVGELNEEAFLKRLSLTDSTKVDTIARRPDTSFLRLMPDASHVYLISEGQILRVPQAPNAQPEIFWQEAGPEAWAMAQTDSHLYWSATTASGTTACSEAQVLRGPKAGGPVTTLSRTPGHCAGEVVRIDNHLYTAVWAAPPSTAPTKILRIRP